MNEDAVKTLLQELLEATRAMTWTHETFHNNLTWWVGTSAQWTVTLAHVKDYAPIATGTKISQGLILRLPVEDAIRVLGLARAQREEKKP